MNKTNKLFDDFIVIKTFIRAVFVAEGKDDIVQVFLALGQLNDANIE
ncbi:MAG: Uncharacterised protein [Cryomorphaceae bacterium]|nr:MAG: Uncharacterised protein [Cryomorphaceae bacterium]